MGSKKTKNFIKKMTSMPEVRTPIGTEIYIPNKSGRAENTELNRVNVSGDPFTSYGKINIDQDANDNSLYIDSEATTEDVFKIDTPVTTTGNIINIGSANSLTTGSALKIGSASGDSTSRRLVNFINDNPTASGTKCLAVQQDSTGEGIFIDQNGNGIALDIDSEATTSNVIEINTPLTSSGKVINLTNLNTLTAGRALSIYSNSWYNSNRSLIYIWNAHTNATGAKCIELRNSAPGTTFKIDQDGNGNSIFIDSEATTSAVFQINDPKNTSAPVCNFHNCNALTTGGILRLHSNSASTSSRALLNVVNDNTLATSTTCLHIQQDSANRALNIDMNGATGNALKINQDSNSASTEWAIDIENNNAGAGSPGGIDFGSFSVDEPILNARTDAITTAGTVSHQIAVEIGGTTYYLVAYTHGS